MGAYCTKRQGLGKLITTVAVTALLAGCSTNPATGERQFTGLMSPQSEAKIGADAHQEALQTYGGLYQNQQLQNYVSEIGQRLSAYSERKDVQYKFFLLDSPVVNAFAIPGGYIYVTRGLLAYTNSEAELAGVMAHEMGHITGRHSAERYSTGMLTQIGATVASAAIGNSAAAQALGVGSNLFLSSYSRGQESEADELGVRYLSAAGYDVYGMSRFLNTLQLETQLQSKISGQQAAPDFFSTHPNTANRVQAAASEARKYPENDGVVNRDRHMNLVDNMLFGDSPSQGFVSGNKFIHPQLGFAFDVPAGHRIINQPSQVLAVSNNGTALILDMVKRGSTSNPAAYIDTVWLKDSNAPRAEAITINGMPAATTKYAGTLNGKSVNIQVVAIAYSPDTFYRFQAAYPTNTPAPTVASLRDSTFSFHRVTETEKQQARPLQIDTVRAGGADTVSSLSAQMGFGNLKEERFRALNGLNANEQLIQGQIYKIAR